MPDMLDRIASQGAPQGDMLDRMATGKPSRWSEPRTLGGKVTKAALKYTGKGLWKGLGVLGWPFQRAEFMTAGPMHAALKARQKTQYEQDKRTVGFGAVAPLGTTRGAGEFAEVGKAMVPALKSLTTWKPPEGVKTWPEVFTQYQSMMHGPGVESYQIPTPLAGLTSLPTPIGPMAQTLLPFLDKNIEVSPEASATAAGVGTSFLTSPKIVSGAFKGLTKLGKATPWYKSYAASRLPALERLMLEHGADKAEGIEKARQLGKTVSTKALKPIAAKLFKTAKPSKSQIAATAKRLKQIEQGGVTTSPELAETAGGFADFWAKNRPVLEKAKLLGKETIFTKLTNKAKGLKRAEIAKLGEQLKKYQGRKFPGRAEKMRQLQDKIADLKLQIYRSEHLGGTLPGSRLIPASKAKIPQNSLELQEFGRRIGKLAGMSDGQVNNIKFNLKKTSFSGTKTFAYADTSVWPEGEIVVNLGDDTPTLEKFSRLIAEELGHIVHPKSGKNAWDFTAQRIEAHGPKLKAFMEKTMARPNIYGDKTPPLRVAGESIPLKYAPRMYDKYEKATRRWPFFSKFRIRRPYAKHREDIPLQARKEMGELTGMGYPEVKRAMQVSNDVATADLFNKVAQTPGWVDDAAEGFKKLPDSKAFGILAGRGVHPTVYNQLRTTVNVKTNAGKLYDAYVGMWKMGKTIWSSALHFRNMFSNSMLNDITGTDHFKQAQMAQKLVGEIRKQSDDWFTIKRYLVRSGFTEAELMDDLMNISQGGKPSRILDILTKIPKGFQRASRVPGNIYAKEEMLGKAIKYLHMRELGKPPMEAVKEANRALFDYGALSAWEKTYARRIMPFYTFPRKAIPVVLQSMRDNPYAVAKYPIMFWGMQQHALKKLEITDEDFAELSEQLPEYMQRGSVMLMPYRDEDNKLRFFDWTYILPWGPMAEMNQRGPLDVVLSNPLFTLVADLQRNKNSFTDKPIYDDSIPWDDMTPDYKQQQNFKKLKYVWQMAAPSLAPGGIYWDKLEQAARGQKPLPETIAHTVFGLRTQPIDTKEAEMWHYKGVDKQIKGLSGQLWSLSYKKAKGTITTEEYERQKKIILDQMKHTTQTNLLMKQTR